MRVQRPKGERSRMWLGIETSLRIDALQSVVARNRSLYDYHSVDRLFKSRDELRDVLIYKTVSDEYVVLAWQDTETTRRFHFVGDTPEWLLDNMRNGRGWFLCESWISERREVLGDAVEGRSRPGWGWVDENGRVVSRYIDDEGRMTVEPGDVVTRVEVMTETRGRKAILARVARQEILEIAKRDLGEKECERLYGVSRAVREVLDGVSDDSVGLISKEGRTVHVEKNGPRIVSNDSNYVRIYSEE